MILKMVIICINHIIAIICIMQNMHIIAIILIISDLFLEGWMESVGSRVAYELDYRKPILYVVPIQSILGDSAKYAALQRPARVAAGGQR
mmetsp:Transcript_42693/g.89284  ORF Transcript_42693/g.89284 Transcript_42693/m.89284 type:complete len:90 (-) Transcript_42693:226-495(-)